MQLISQDSVEDFSIMPAIRPPYTWFVSPKSIFILVLTSFILSLIGIFIPLAIPGIGVLLGFKITVQFWVSLTKRKWLFILGLGTSLLMSALTSVNYYFLCEILPKRWGIWRSLVAEKCIEGFEKDLSILLVLFIMLSIVIIYGSTFLSSQKPRR